ncbi:hypothetical protein G7067_04975 [Leucobacter insecticola]|uniref:Uncharacterized protein n=1 Tax=Leucobacter insecticola TaxID=2714934 RepID=A0A6G8FHT1_9MICO|nr:hypothetical protein [Leucobacter insecticola]QIM15917.1 hypothetical protein G7067_04975 [Leucobacter insecticola]
MTDVPADAASVLPNATPKAGGTGKIDAAAAFAQELVNDANQFQLSVQGAQSEFYGVKSKGIDKLDAKLGDRLIPGAQTLERSASESKAAFDTYAAEVTRINKDADRVVEQINDALATIRIAVGTIDEISRIIRSYQTYTWRDVPPGAMPDPRLGSDAADLTSAERAVEVQTLRSVYEYQWGVATSNWLSAVADINRAVQTWSTLIKERESAEGALVKALEMTGIGELISINGGVSGLPAFTIAQRVSGELWGEESAALSLAKEHPLLENLLGTSDGERSFESPPHPILLPRIGPLYRQSNKSD